MWLIIGLITDKALMIICLKEVKFLMEGIVSPLSLMARKPTIKPIIYSTSYSVAENQRNIGFINAYDPDNPSDPWGEDLDYAISGTDADSISVTEVGYLTFNPGSEPDYETKNSYLIIAEVSDDMSTTQKALPISIENLDDNMPEITSNPNFYVMEGETDIGQVEAYDADGDPFTFGNSNPDIRIDDQGFLTFNIETNWDDKRQYFDEVYVVQNQTIASEFQNITINIERGNRDAPVFTSGNFSVEENQSFIGTVTATDPDGDTVTFEIHDGFDGAQDLISINASTGELTFNTPVTMNQEHPIEFLFTPQMGCIRQMHKLELMF